MASVTLQIEKLSKDNYDTWRQQIEAILVKNDHWDFVDGSNVKPAEVALLADASNQAAVTANCTSILEWEKKDRKAKADLILAILPSELCYVKLQNF